MVMLFGPGRVPIRAATSVLINNWYVRARDWIWQPGPNQDDPRGKPAGLTPDLYQEKGIAGLHCLYTQASCPDTRGFREDSQMSTPPALGSWLVFAGQNCGRSCRDWVLWPVQDHTSMLLSEIILWLHAWSPLSRTLPFLHRSLGTCSTFSGCGSELGLDLIMSSMRRAAK